MSRIEHVILKNKSSQRPQHVIFFDCETTPVSISPTEKKQILRLGWACYMPPSEPSCLRLPVWCFFTSSENFWTFVEKYVQPKRKLYLVAHNIAFDFRIVGGFDYMEKSGWKLTFFYNKGQTCLLTYRKANATLQLLDMTNFYPMALKAVGEAVGITKTDIDFENASFETLAVYCHNDVEIMIEAWQTWLDFLDNHDLGNFQHTLPSQAFTAYRHRFMPYPIHIHNNESVCKLEREAYRGGRVEVFWQGERWGKVYYQLDVNAMYSHVMVNHKYPTKLLGQRYYMSIRKMSRMLKHSAMIAKVLIETDQPVFPVRKGNRNVYPIGTYETTLTTPELRYAIDRGLIKEIKHVSWYRSKPIFKRYSSYFAELKTGYSMEDNAAFRIIAKLFGNALYGKFGQRGIKTTIRYDVPKQAKTFDAIIEVTDIEFSKSGKRDKGLKELKRKITSKVFGRSYRLGGQYIVEEVSGESYNSFPGIAAHVTAYARMYLWELILQAGRENSFYCDTDCLIVNQRGYDNLWQLLDDHAIGALKVEKRADHLIIFSAKDYVLGDKVRTKGIRRNAKHISNNTYEQEQFLGLSGSIGRGQPDLVTIKTIRKTLTRTVKTGIVGKDGWVIPFQFPL